MNFLKRERAPLTDRAWQYVEDEAARALIFRAGFSTRERITDLSGRGVGMDVVRSVVEQCHGSIQLDSQLGSGTRIALTFAPQIAFRIFSAVAIVGVIAFTIISVATGYIWSTVPINDGEAPLPVPWLLVILAAVFVCGPYVLKRVGVSEGPWLLDFVMTLLEARFDSDGDAAA